MKVKSLTPFIISFKISTDFGPCIATNALSELSSILYFLDNLVLKISKSFSLHAAFKIIRYPSFSLVIIRSS